MARILHVDDNEQLQFLLRSILESRGHEVVSAPDGQKGLARFHEQPFDVVVSDIQMPVMDGLQFLEAVMRERPETPVVMATSVDTIKTALNALKTGAFDYVLKPFKVPVLVDTVQRALASERTQAAAIPPERTMSGYYALPGVIAVSAQMRSACDAVRQVAPLKTPHLIAGEPGTGRALLAQSIHALGTRSQRPFVRYVCRARGAGPRVPFISMVRDPRGGQKGQLGGALMDACGGTIAIEDVEWLPLEYQDLLLELIRTGTVACENVTAVPHDIRILAISQHDLRSSVEKGTLRGEFVEAVTRLPVLTAPLRDRPEDIVPLAWHFLSAIAGGREKVPGIARGTRAALEHYRWPGNTDELADALQQAFRKRSGGILGIVDLPAAIIESLEDLNAGRSAPDDAQERGQAFRQRLADSLAAQLDKTATPVPRVAPANLPGPEAEGKAGAYVLPGPVAVAGVTPAAPSPEPQSPDEEAGNVPVRKAGFVSWLRAALGRLLGLRR